jgi:hypothetical protein
MYLGVLKRACTSFGTCPLVACYLLLGGHHASGHLVAREKAPPTTNRLRVVAGGQAGRVGNAACQKLVGGLAVVLFKAGIPRCPRTLVHACSVKHLQGAGHIGHGGHAYRATGSCGYCSLCVGSYNSRSSGCLVLRVGGVGLGVGLGHVSHLVRCRVSGHGVHGATVAQAAQAPFAIWPPRGRCHNKV